MCFVLCSEVYSQLNCSSPVDIVLTGTVNTPYLQTNKVIEIHGTVTFRRGATLNNCLIKAMPGSKIYCGTNPIFTRKTYRFNNTKFQSCSGGTWSGISISPFVTAYFSNQSKISDAQIGVKAGDVSVVSFENTSFIDNQLGIHLSNSATLLNLSLCNFERTSNSKFLADYGIELSNCSQKIIIGSVGNSQNFNSFKSLNTGITSENSNFHVSNSVFNLCQYGIDYDNTNDVLYDCNVVGFGKESQYVFNNIISSNIIGYGTCNLNITNCRSKRDASAVLDSYHGIEIYWNNKGKIEILNNKFETNGLVITPSGARHVMIQVEGSNTLLCNILDNIHDDVGSSFIRTIQLSTTNASGNFIYINDNRILGDNQSKELGIFTSFCKDLKIHSNFCKRNAIGIINPFISLSDCSKADIRYNEVDEPKSNVGMHYGIFVQNTSDAYLCGNRLISVGHGIVASGKSTNLTVSQNDLKNTFRGLWYQNGTLTNFVNDHRLNIFFGPSSIFHAHHEGATYRLNPYIVRNDNTYIITAAYKPPTVSPGGQQWFKFPSVGNAKGCALAFNSGDRYFQPYTDGEYLNSLSPGIRWDGLTDFYLYSKYNSDNSNNTVALQNLYLSLSQQNLGFYANVKELIDKYYIIAPSSLQILEVKQQEISAILDSLDLLNESILNMSDLDSTTTFIDEKDSLIQILNTKYDEYILSSAQIQNVQNTKINDILNLNNNLVPNNIYESDQKFLNNMWIKKMQHIEYSSTEINQIISLAERCLPTFGDQVMFAQSLIDDTHPIDREPDMFCNNSNPQPLINSSNFMHSCTMELNTHDVYSFNTKAIEFELIDMQGIVISSGKIVNNLLEVNLTNLLNGIYILKLNHEQSTELHRLLKH